MPSFVLNTVSEWFCRQPIALIGHDGLELGGSRSDPVSLPNNLREIEVSDYYSGISG